jgi:hypothetical protein
VIDSEGSKLLPLPLTGGCLCGAIRYEVTAAPLGVYACHCTDCQKQSASAFALAVPVLRAAFRVTAGAPVAWTRKSPGGATVLSWFCGTCACRIYGEREGRPSVLNIRAGSLDDTSWIANVAHLWTRSAQPWMHFGPGALIHETQPEDFRAFVASSRQDQSAGKFAP